MSGPRVDGNLSSMVLCGRPSSEAATVPGADCHSAVAMPPPCKPFWPKNHAIRPYFDTFQGNSYSGDLPTSGKLRTNRQLVGIQEPYSLHIVEGNGPGSSGAGWNGGGRVQNKPRMLGGFHQTRSPCRFGFSSTTLPFGMAPTSLKIELLAVPSQYLAPPKHPLDLIPPFPG